MSEAVAAQKPLPVVPYLKIPEQGDPFLQGSKCKKCGAIYLGQREVCGKCFARNQFDVIKLSNKGELHVFSIVHRSFPGIPVPFISAVVDLEGGGTVKGTLIGIEPSPDKIKLGMPVKVVFQDAGRKDAKGNSYISFFFQPA